MRAERAWRCFPAIAIPWVIRKLLGTGLTRLANQREPAFPHNYFLTLHLQPNIAVHRKLSEPTAATAVAVAAVAQPCSGNLALQAPPPSSRLRPRRLYPASSPWWSSWETSRARSSPTRRLRDWWTGRRGSPARSRWVGSDGAALHGAGGRGQGAAWVPPPPPPLPRTSAHSGSQLQHLHPHEPPADRTTAVR